MCILNPPADLPQMIWRNILTQEYYTEPFAQALLRGLLLQPWEGVSRNSRNDTHACRSELTFFCPRNALQYFDTLPQVLVFDADVGILDHCIEILRINLMCTSDISILTYNWVQHWDTPTPNFNTKHICRDFDAILGWSESHTSKFGPLRKLGGELELEEWM